VVPVGRIMSVAVRHIANLADLRRFARRARG
jgi:hypothetical protein